MFKGTYRITLDEKNRIRIPTKLRVQLGMDIILFCGNDGYLCLMNQEKFDAMFEGSENIFISDDRHKALRRVYATADTPEEDQQGRFVLQPEMKAYMKANKKLVFIGVRNMIEICSEETFNSFMNEVSVSESLKALAPKTSVGINA